MADKMRELLSRWRQSISSGALPPVLALVGQSETVLKRAMEMLETSVFSAGGKGLNHHIVDGRATKPAEWALTARTAPMMAKRRLVQVNDADTWFKKDLNKKGVEALGPLLEYGHSGATKGLVVLLARTADKASVLGRDLTEMGGLFGFETLETRQDTHEFIHQLFKRRGISIDGAAVAYLADALGSSAEAILSEVKKLAEYADEAGVLTVQDAQEMVQRLKGHELYELSRALSQKDTRKSLTILDRMYHNLLSSRKKISASGLPLVILSSCVEGEFRKLALAKAYEPTMDAAGLARRLKTRDTVARAILANARRFTEEELTDILTHTREVDKRFKSTSLPSKLLLEDLFISICTGGKRR